MILIIPNRLGSQPGRRELEEKTDVVIVGAGIAGLALAVELQKRDVSTLLLDRRKGPESTPRGITFQPNGLEALEKIGILDQVRQMGSAERILEVRDWDRQLLLEVDYAVLDHPHNYILTVNAVQVEQLLGYNAENMGARTLWSTGFDDILWNTGLAQGVRVKVKDEPADIKASVIVGADRPSKTIPGSRKNAGNNARRSRCKLHVLLRWKTPVRRSEEAGGRTVQGRGHRSRSRTEGSFRSRGGMDEDRLLHTKLHQSRPVGEQWGCSTRRLRPHHPSTRRAGREPLTTGRSSAR